MVLADQADTRGVETVGLRNGLGQATVAGGELNHDNGPKAELGNPCQLLTRSATPNIMIRVAIFRDR